MYNIALLLYICREENKELPKNKPDYQGGDYDKPEEEGNVLICC